MKNAKFLSSAVILLIFAVSIFAQNGFVKVKDNQFFIGEKPYYFIGANYWYGSLLGLEKDKTRGAERLRKEPDFLQKTA